MLQFEKITDLFSHRRADSMERIVPRESFLPQAREYGTLARSHAVVTRLFIALLVAVD